MIVCKNISGNLMLIPSPNIPIDDLIAYLPLIQTTAQSMHQSLLTPHLNEKWHKLAIHRIPIDIFPDSLEGMTLLQQEIERKNNMKLAQTPKYISCPEK
jgi:hypothetical protein